jgi:hypothetical protein
MPPPNAEEMGLLQFSPELDGNCAKPEIGVKSIRAKPATSKTLLFMMF